MADDFMMKNDLDVMDDDWWRRQESNSHLLIFVENGGYFPYLFQNTLMWAEASGRNDSLWRFLFRRSQNFRRAGLRIARK